MSVISRFRQPAWELFPHRLYDVARALPLGRNFQIFDAVSCPVGLAAGSLTNLKAPQQGFPGASLIGRKIARFVLCSADRLS